MNAHPVVVVGAGPVGLAAAAHALERGLDPLVLEAGSQAGASVREWGHVRLFSRWAELVDPGAERLLADTGWQRPDPTAHPTGAEWAAQYLAPLAAALGERVRFRSRVVGVARRGRDRVVDAGREHEPLTVHVDGDERITARAVIDASGTWANPNPLGGDGLPAAGERGLRITYRVPDLAESQRFAGGRVAVVGSGHSALTALVSLSEVAAEVVWVLRREATGNAFGGGEDDQLPARGALGLRAQRAVESGRVRVIAGFRTASVEADGDGRLVLESFEGDKADPVDEVVALTGFRPDLSWLSEVRLGLDPVLQAPVALAPLIDPNVHSCGTVYPHGAAELSHPEPGVFLAGMKSYGRAPTFLAMTGYEQVRSVVAAIDGDTDAAARVELELPETGVCSGAGLLDEPAADQDGGCCGAPEAER